MEKAAQEIDLSKKECELLSIFIEKPNEIIKRDELIKRVWEDNGVVVGRSLDTFISKLRKKLQDDTSIKISNVHGVGYKLEI
jgi:DNA-binding response OmpR family regulator